MLSIVSSRHQMAFINDSTIVITEYQSHCLRSFDYPDGGWKTFAGSCGESGSLHTGGRLAVRLNLPYGVAYDNDNTVYFTLERDQKIISIKLDVSSCEVFYAFTTTAGLHYIKHSIPGNYLFVSTSDGYEVVDVDNTALLQKQLKSSTVGFNYVSGVVQIEDQVWAISDTKNSRFTLTKNVIHKILAYHIMWIANR